MTSISFHYPTNVVGTSSNKGFHPQGKRNYKKAVQTITSFLHRCKESRLYHLCFQGRTNNEHKAMLKALALKLTRKKMPHEWFSAREVDSEKGEHLHVFMLVDSAEANAAGILNGFEDQFLGAECKKRGIDLHVNKPRNEIHEPNRYAALPNFGPSGKPTPLGKARWEDAKAWLTYIYKRRGKPEADDRKVNGQIFSASRPSRQRRKA